MCSNVIISFEVWLASYVYIIASYKATLTIIISYIATVHKLAVYTNSLVNESYDL